MRLCVTARRLSDAANAAAAKVCVMSGSRTPSRGCDERVWGEGGRGADGGALQ